MTNEISLKPCLVLGTGFHQWVLGDTKDYGALISWQELLQTTARNLQIPWSDVHGTRLLIQWERLILTAATNGYFNSRSDHWIKAVDVKQAYRIEAVMKREVACILRNIQRKYPLHSTRACFPRSGHWGAVISLNFDTAWFDGKKISWTESVKNDCTSKVRVSSERERQRLNYSCQNVAMSKDSYRVWFPNGCTERHESLRLGLRDFGLQAPTIKCAFDEVKRFESTYRSSRKVDWAGYFEALRPVMDGGDTLQDHYGSAMLPLTWVTEILYRPVLFAGLSLSQNESGLWWIMCQRARNLAHIPERKRPKTGILLRHDNPELDFWLTRPFGIEPLVHSNWSDAWEKEADWGYE